MKNNKSFRCVFTFVLVLWCTIIIPVYAYAETEQLPLYALIPGDHIDFDITESVTMTRSDDADTIIMNSIKLTNNTNNGTKLTISCIDVAPSEGWSLAAADTDFSNVHDSRRFSITTGAHDFAEGAYIVNETIGQGETAVFEFEGKIGTFSNDIYEQAGIVTVTVNAERPAA